MIPKYELMSALADGTLDAADKERAEQLLQADHEALSEFEWAVMLKQSVREHCRPVAASEEWRAAKSRLDEIDRVKKAEHFVSKYSWALCGIFLVAIVSAAVFNRGVSRPLGNAHVAGLFSGLQLEPAGSETQVIESVRKRLGEVPKPVAHLPGRVTHVACGQIDGRSAIRLSLQDSAGQLTFFSIRSTTSIDALQRVEGDYQLGLLGGVPAVAWVDGGYLLILAGDRSFETLIQSAESIKSSR
jgi:anti-sigma factor RsiW